MLLQKHRLFRPPLRRPSTPISTIVVATFIVFAAVVPRLRHRRYPPCPHVTCHKPCVNLSVPSIRPSAPSFVRSGVRPPLCRRLRRRRHPRRRHIHCPRRRRPPPSSSSLLLAVLMLFVIALASLPLSHPSVHPPCRPSGRASVRHYAVGVVVAVILAIVVLVVLIVIVAVHHQVLDRQRYHLAPPSLHSFTHGLIRKETIAHVIK